MAPHSAHKSNKGSIAVKVLSIPFGGKTFEINIEEKSILDVLCPRATAERDSLDVLRKALDDPLDSPSLRVLTRTQDPLLCIVNDATRPTKTCAVLNVLRKHLQNTDIHFLIATGAHRTPTNAELRRIFGEYYLTHQHRILVHDARDEETMVYFGKTRYGNELWLNKALKEYEKILIIGSVEPHYFAGFTGGRKSILPGVAAYRTIEQNHKHALSTHAKPISLNNNPIHEEMIDCMNMLGDKLIFSIQIVLDKDQNIFAAYSGSIDRTFETATRIATKLYRAEIPTRADIVVSVAQKPFDMNLYQSLKAIEHGRLALREGGILIIISACPEGLGPSSFSRLFRDHDSLEKAATNAQVSYKLGDHNARNLFSLVRHNEIWAVTTIQKKILNNARIRSFTSVQAAIDQAIRDKGDNAQVLFMLNACLTVPQIV